MALLTEIDEIERNSTRPLPVKPEGDPDAGDLDTEHPEFAAISAARRLRSKVRAIIMIHAKTLLSGQQIPVLDYSDPENPVALRNPYPAPGKEANEAIGWAQGVLSGLDGAPLATAFRAALVNSPDINSAAVPVDFILALGSSTDIAVDESLRRAFVPILPVLAKGSHPGS